MVPIQLTLGAAASRRWLQLLKLRASQDWFVEVGLDVASRQALLTYNSATATRFHLSAFAEEWGIFLCHGARSSWLRVTDTVFVHGNDDFALLGELPDLRDVGALLRTIEGRHGIAFQRAHALVCTNLGGGSAAIRSWVREL
jgi:hypothetical protein